MSRSSSGSWSARAPADIIDLDRFMRAARPDARERQLARNGLVVDGGSLARKPASSSSSASSRSALAPPRRDKRFSHDSGLSDGSYKRRRHRPHRRVGSGAEGGAQGREAAGARAGSSASLRAFRAACERALRDQQQAITRVAQLCERLTERRERTPPRSSDTSDLSSSSRSTRDPRRKDKHRTEECKTYKIIMTKLDELNRLFVARGRSPPAPRADARLPQGDARAPARADARAPEPHGREARRARDSASSVSVSDKLVATEPEPVTTVVPPTQITAERIAVEAMWKPKPSASRLVERAVGSEAPRLRRRAAGRARGDCAAGGTDSELKSVSSAEGLSSGACAAHCGFDLDDPVHLYAQAKRLQALRGAARGAACGAARGAARRGARWGGACAGCLRALHHCLAAPLCCPAPWP